MALLVLRGSEVAGLLPITHRDPTPLHRREEAQGPDNHLQKRAQTLTPREEKYF